jgi:hypothetical protein
VVEAVEEIKAIKAAIVAGENIEAVWEITKLD